LLRPRQCQAGVDRTDRSGVANREIFGAKSRGGIHHFSLAAENFDAAIESLTAKGINLLGSKGQQNVDGDPIAFIHPKDFLGSRGIEDIEFPAQNEFLEASDS
jgi:hypothetical protein